MRVACLSVACVVVLAATPLFGSLTATVQDSFGGTHTPLVTPAWAGDGFGTHGGEFLVKLGGVTPERLPSAKADPARTAGQFETFCVERNESLGFGTPYYGTLGTSAIKGGIGGGSPDPLDNLTAWLYCEFVKGTLTGYDYGTGVARVDSANALQDAIWYIEDELGAGYTLTGAAKDFYDLAVAADPKGLGCTRVLNLYVDKGLTQVKQSLLVCVPAPAALVLGLFGLALTGWVKRRMA